MRCYILVPRGNNHEVVQFHTNKNIVNNLEESCNPFGSSLISTSKGKNVQISNAFIGYRQKKIMGWRAG